MKKLILTVSFLILTILNINSQTVEKDGYWENGYYIDDFGEKTGDTFIQQWTMGKFSNSATSSSKCNYRIKSYPKVLLIDIYPYDDGIKENFLVASQQILKIKTPSGEIKEFKIVTTEDGTIVFDKKRAKEYKDLLIEKGEFKVVLNYRDEYSNSRYEFSFFN